MPRQRVFRRRENGLFQLAVTLLILGSLAATGYVWINGRTGDVSNPGVEFNEPSKRRQFNIRAETFVWPVYGYTAARTRDLPARVRPPFKPLWRFNANQLLEFSPILVHGTLYVVRKDSRVFAINAKTGRHRWTKKVGSLSAASPAYANGRIFVVTLSGRMVALNARTGHIRWAKNLGARSESSPLTLGDSVIFGTQAGTLYRLRQSNGRIEWTYQAGGAIKGGPAYADGKVFVGAYGGTVHAVRVRDGAQVWKSSTSGARFGFGSGNFYATPAVAYGRVYLGNTDGRVYSFAASNGRLAWSKATGAYVYGAAAIDNVNRLGPTVFVGSYDGNFYALDARTGGVRWSYSSGGQISGAPTVVGGVVYFSTIDTTNTYGLSTRTGRRVYARGSGAYNPVISDGHRIYMTGYESLSAYVMRRDFKRESKERRAALRRH
ncbi:MAG: PQQ-binding-like beta-propeller repeat protein [Thermoleophilia bacterium]|nr:PQQ-binding-like beta-propeller repeat protein [Thermoleophilia bacterium]